MLAIDNMVTMTQAKDFQIKPRVGIVRQQFQVLAGFDAGHGDARPQHRLRAQQSGGVLSQYGR
ncbi:MAG: hypothetical protein Tsb002_05850 [Wenzhouxiangellaceae bacterium]